MHPTIAIQEMQKLMQLMLKSSVSLARLQDALFMIPIVLFQQIDMIQSRAVK